MGGHLLALVCLWAAVGALAASSSSSMAWRRFKSEHAKVYGAEEDAMRFANFLATKQLVEHHNAISNATYKMGLNHMADWTHEERQKLTGIELSETQRENNDDSHSPKLAKLLDGPVPKEVDWRKVPNRVTAVKQQLFCNSGWAFATTGLLEGQQAVLNMSRLIPLSAQELIDCSKSNLGCKYGSTISALNDISCKLEGIESEEDYPYEGFSEADYQYEGFTDSCMIDRSLSVMTTQGGLYLNKGNEEDLLKAVANYGPVATPILATNNFYHYRSGVFDDPLCNQYKNMWSHVALVVGYGTDLKEGDYWLVKNSFGAKWGDEGYIKMKRGVNMCNIADNAIVALF